MKIHLLGFLTLSMVILLCGRLYAEDKTLEGVEIKNITVPIICYHSVIPDKKNNLNFTPEQLETQLKFYKEHNYQPITALQYIKLQKMPEFFPEKPIVLTFDDGNKSHYQYVLPLLEKYNIQATFFVCPSIIAEKSDTALTWGELQEMARAGMDIESHTMTHADLPSLVYNGNPQSLEKLEYELKSSREVLESKIGRKVNLLAYPSGFYAKEVEDYAVKAGYQGIFTVNCGVNRPDENPYRLKRIALTRTLSLEEIEAFITTKPFEVDIISPPDGSMVSEKPEIKFKPTAPGMNRIDIMIRKTISPLNPDEDGVYTYEPEIKKPGFYTVIIRGYDSDNNYLRMGSWGFTYLPGYEADNSQKGQ